MIEWIDWINDNPVQSIGGAAAVALSLLAIIIGVRLAFAALLRRIFVGLRLKKKMEKDNPWMDSNGLAENKLRPMPRKGLFGRRSA